MIRTMSEEFDLEILEYKIKLSLIRKSLRYNSVSPRKLGPYLLLHSSKNYNNLYDIVINEDEISKYSHNLAMHIICRDRLSYKFYKALNKWIKKINAIFQ